MTPEGRITYGDLGLYDDANEAHSAGAVGSIRRSPIPIAHAAGACRAQGLVRAALERRKQIAPARRARLAD